MTAFAFRTRQLFHSTSPASGIVMMCISMVFMTALAGMARYMMESVHPFQVVLLRNIFAFVTILPFLIPLGWRGMRTTRLRLHVLRAAVGTASMLTWFWALAHLPFAEAITFSFTTPLFATIGAALVLKEVVHMRRWLAIGVGFLGVLIMLRPGGASFQLADGLALVSALLMAVSTLLIKSLVGTEPVRVVLFYMGVFMIPLSLPAALPVWESLAPVQWAMGLLMGICATLAHVTLNRAFALSDASAVQPFDFIRLPLAAGVGYLIWNEKPDVWTWIGGAVIVASSVYIAHREALHARRAHAEAKFVAEREAQEIP
jgi:drug/metabolite transporter (DMT)-like permease